MTTSPTPYGWNPLYEPRIADADPLDLRQQIYDEGLRLRWEKASRCACTLQQIDAESDYNILVQKEGRPTCPDCKGSGWAYYHAQEIRALVHDTSADPQWLKVYGQLMDGSVSITLLPEHVPGERDRFVCLDQWRRYSETIVHATNPEPLTYPILVVPTTVGTVGDPTLPTTIDLGILNARRATSRGILVNTPMVVGTDIDVSDGEVEYLNAGTYASGNVLIKLPPELAGDTLPAGTEILVGDAEIPYAITTEAGFIYPFNPGVLAGVVVSARAVAVGTSYNQPAGTELLPAVAVLPDNTRIEGVTITIGDGFDNGTNAGVGGNIPEVGDQCAFDYYCRFQYVVRKIPRASREAYVVQTPYVNTTSGDQGYWDASGGTFPSGTIARGDYFEVNVPGTVDGVAFVVGQMLLAQIDSPSTTVFAGQWQRLTPGVNEPVMVKLSSMVLAWLEDLGDPFQRSGLTP